MGSRLPAQAVWTSACGRFLHWLCWPNPHHASMAFAGKGGGRGGGALQPLPPFIQLQPKNMLQHTASILHMPWLAGTLLYDRTGSGWACCLRALSREKARNRLLCPRRMLRALFHAGHAAIASGRRGPTVMKAASLKACFVHSCFLKSCWLAWRQLLAGATGGGVSLPSSTRAPRSVSAAMRRRPPLGATAEASEEPWARKFKIL